MSTVTIRRKPDEAAEQFEFIAWKDNCRAFYARPQNGRPRVVTLLPALPEGAEWIRKPFSESPPVRINPCRLLPPSCMEEKPDLELVEQLFSGEDDLSRQMREAASTEYLFLTPEDEAPLEVLRAAWVKCKQEEHERDYAWWCKQIEDAEAKGRIVEEGCAARKQKQQLDELERQRQMVVQDEAPAHRFHGIQCAGSVNLTLEMVKRRCGELPGAPPGRTCIRDAFLVERWARTNHVDLAEMDRQRAECRKWADSCAGLPAIRHDKMMEASRASVSPFLSSETLFLDYCAGVRFRVEFADKSVAYLAGCPPPRKELRAEEWKELKREHGFETPHERHFRKARKKGGHRSTKVKDKTEKTWIVNEIRKRLAKGTKPTTAAKDVCRFYKDRFKRNPPHWKTLLNYYRKSAADTETGNR